MVDKSEKFSTLVRVGYFSRAILYSVLGLIALTSAGRISEGTNGIFQAIRDFPLGTAILWLMVVGLLAYALFRFASTFFDIENHGTDTKGWAMRVELYQKRIAYALQSLQMNCRNLTETSNVKVHVQEYVPVKQPNQNLRHPNEIVNSFYKIFCRY